MPFCNDHSSLIIFHSSLRMGLGVAMRKGLKRSGLLLIATIILALAYHFGNQSGFPPYEPPAYDPADLAPPTPIVEETPSTGSDPLGSVPNSSPNESGHDKQEMPLSRKIKIISIHSAPSEIKAKVLAVQPTSGAKDDPAKSAAPLNPSNSQEELATRVPAGIRRRPIEDDDVAWHIIDSPVSNLSHNSSAKENLLPEPGALLQGIPDRVGLPEAPKRVIPAMPRTLPAEPTRRSEPIPQPAMKAVVPKQSALPPQAAPTADEPKSKLADSFSSMNSTDFDRFLSQVADDAPTPMAPAVTNSTPLANPNPVRVEQESKAKSHSGPPTAPPAPTASPTLVGSPTPMKVKVSDQKDVSQPRTGLMPRIPDSTVQLTAGIQAAPKVNTRKIRIVGLYPRYPEPKKPSQASKPTIRSPEPKTVAPASVAPATQSWLPPVSPSFAGTESSADLTPAKNKVSQLPSVHQEAKVASPSPMSTTRESNPAFSSHSGATTTVPPSRSEARGQDFILPVNRQVGNVPPQSLPRIVGSTSPPVKLPIIVNGKPAPEKAKTAPPKPLAVPSDGVILLPPPELPQSVTASATEMATQKLIARSMSSPTGVAARLAHAKIDSSGPGGAELILAGGSMESHSTPIDEGHVKSYTTTGMVKLTASKEEIAANAHLDYVTSGVVILGDPDESTITLPLSVREKELKKAIQAACGDRFKDLGITMNPDHTLHIRLNTLRKDEQDVRQTILALPALANYKVSLNIQVFP